MSARSAAIVLSALGLLCCLNATAALAQDASATAARIAALFAPLELTPTPSKMRLATGAPGPEYWQNRADYDLKATLDTATRIIHGSMVLRYTNNSPHTLDVIWLQTERAWPAIDTIGDTLRHRQGTIETFTQRVSGKPTPLTLEGHHTVSKVTLAEPLKPGQTATFESTWSFKEIRLDRDLYHVTQWYPRMVVYDDVKGWNPDPWVAEFFLEYGDFTMEITLPAGYIVAGTGTLDNPSEVLPASISAKLAQAKTSDTVIRIITRDEMAQGMARPTKTGMLTWKFHAQNVRDAVWAASTNYLWDGRSWHGILLQSLYHLTSPKIWEQSTEMILHTVQEYSEHWFPYPYPQATAADAADAQEYPMIVLVGISERYASIPGINLLFTIINHEIGHQWFPMIVGSNERAHGWMDEGFNTFADALSEKRWYPTESPGMMEAGKIDGGLHTKVPIEIPGALAINTQYDAPGAVLTLLRTHVLGPQLFDKAMQTYIKRWAYKHPTPADFFRTIEDVSQRKLDWFWREWFYTPQSYDIAIDSVAQTRKGDDTQIAVTYRNIGSGVLPIVAVLTYSDSTSETVVQPAERWQAGPVQTVTYTAHNKTLVKLAIDPTGWLPDENPKNGEWVSSARP